MGASDRLKKIIILGNRNVIQHFRCIFAGVKLDNCRHIASWLLLAVFVPMLVLSSLHVHEDGAASAVTECADCLHHSCHGHLTQMATWAHDCVLCQFLTLSFVATAAVTLLVIHRVTSSRTDARRRNVCVAHSGIVGLRAPPAFSI